MLSNSVIIRNGKVLANNASQVACPSCGLKKAVGNFWITAGLRRVMCHVSEIVAMKTCGKYVSLFMADGEVHVVQCSIRQWLSLYPGEWFRINRNAAVRLSAITRIESCRDRFGEANYLVHIGEKSWEVSRRRTPELRKQFPVNPKRKSNESH